MKRLAVVIAAAAALWRPALLEAVLVIPMTFEQLVDEAEAVVYARVVDVRGQWTADRQGIDSVVTAEALRYLKGDFGPRVVLRLPGGEAGGRIQVIPGAPVLREGDLVVLFLDARGPALPTLLGLSQGVFRVAPDVASRRMLVAAPALKASPAGSAIRRASARGVLSIDALGAAVQEARAR